jgi:uncharacterized protein (DUF1015 family)
VCYAGAMPRFEPFMGLRYDPQIPLDEVIAPPYDVVAPEERAKLAARHPANSIHVELPEDDPDLGLDRYQNAARLLGDWKEQGVLRRDRGRCIYPYRMTEPGGSTTTGVIGALGSAVGPSGSKSPGANGGHDGGDDVLPHEQTTPKDMSDRLQLLRACRTNLSPIWGLSLTEGLSRLYAPSGPPLETATDDSGVTHELWAVDDVATVEEVGRAMAASAVVIADGHHRYATSLAYASEMRQATGRDHGDFDLVMALLVELSEDQLSVGAIHRVIEGIGRSERAVSERVLEVFGPWFNMEDLGAPDDRLVSSLVREDKMGLITASRSWRLDPTRDALSRAGSDLDSSLVALALERAPDVGVEYRHDPSEALSEVASGTRDAAVILRPVTVAQISSWARAGKRMPPKSTYFHPKPRTGMVFRPLGD